MEKPGPCNPACSQVIKFMTDHKIPASTGIGSPPYKNVDGYRHLNVFVQFSQAAATEKPVDLGLIFGFDESGKMGARHYVNLEFNLASPQATNIIQVSGAGAWSGNPHNTSHYVARFPVMGPFVEVFVYNREALERTVSVWGYATS